MYNNLDISFSYFYMIGTYLHFSGLPPSSSTPKSVATTKTLYVRVWRLAARFKRFVLVCRPRVLYYTRSRGTHIIIYKGHWKRPRWYLLPNWYADTRWSHIILYYYYYYTRFYYLFKLCAVPFFSDYTLTHYTPSRARLGVVLFIIIPTYKTRWFITVSARVNEK